MGNSNSNNNSKKAYVLAISEYAFETEEDLQNEPASFINGL